MADGWITIGTKIDNSNFDRQAQEIENKISIVEKKQEIANKTTAKYQDELSKAKMLVQELETEYEQLSIKIQKVEDILAKQAEGKSLSPQEFMDIQGYEEISSSAEKLGVQLDKAYKTQFALGDKIEASKLKEEQLTNEAERYRNKLEQIKYQQHTRGIASMEKGMKNVGKSINNNIKSIGRMVLAIFSIRSAYMMIRSAVSTLSQYNAQFATNLSYIRYALAQMLAPIIEYILNLVYKLLQYINYIANAWFGVNLFAKAGAESFSKANKNLAGASKSAKELKKTLAGFDEMNVLQDTSSSAGGGAGGATAPTFDLASMQGEVPEWLKWIGDNAETIIGAMLGIATMIELIKLKVDKLFALGIGLIIAGLVKTIGAIIKFIKDPSWENFSKILEGLAVTLAGVAVAMLAVNAANPVAWIILAIAAVVALVAIIIQKKDEVVDALKKAWETIKNVFSVVGQFFKNIFTNAYENIKNVFSQIPTFFGNIWNTIKSKFQSFGVAIGEAFGGAFKSAINAVLRTIENMVNVPIRAINGLLSLINKVPGINLPRLNTLTLPRLAVGGIVNMPGKGIPIGRAIAGEAGAEGVIPLTDSQAMETLGEAIGRYITINANIVNTMNGRVLSREMKQIQNDRDFAYNS